MSSAGGRGLTLPHFIRRGGPARPMTIGGHFGAPSPVTTIEARHGFAGARRAIGGWGPFRGPMTGDDDRGAPRLCRGATSDRGVGGHFGAPNIKGPRPPGPGGTPCVARSPG